MESGNRDYYNRSANERLRKNLSALNRRQVEVLRLCRAYIKKEYRVLEIGCGVGVITKYLAKRGSEVVAIDISENNVDLARKYNSRVKNVQFSVHDVVSRLDDLHGLGTFDAILMSDVIEHLPKTIYGSLFKVVESVLREPGYVLLTFPSPEYQDYIKQHEPQQLQAVDETVFFKDIYESTTLKPMLFKYTNCWMKNQYIHLVLSSSVEIKKYRMKPADSFIYMIRNRIWKVNNHKALRDL
jgi:2-polyprenyl-3-methyl-5-hydroxy-6-metoxy-1,4-benzoquinol methylase